MLYYACLSANRTLGYVAQYHMYGDLSDGAVIRLDNDGSPVCGCHSNSYIGSVGTGHSGSPWNPVFRRVIVIQGDCRFGHDIGGRLYCDRRQKHRRQIAANKENVSEGEMNQ